MQLMPGTAARFDVKDPFNIEQNIMGGAKYLRVLFDQFNGDLRLTLAAYNAGEGRGRSKTPEARLSKLYGENISGVGDYVDTIMRFFTRYQTGVYKPAPVTVQRGGLTADESRELAELTKAREEINAETLDHLEVLQLEQQRLGRWFKALTKEIGTGTLSEAASSDIIKRKAELEAAMERNAKEYESYWLTQLQLINSLDEKIQALKGRSRDMGLAAETPNVELPTGHKLNSSQYLKPAAVDAGQLSTGIHSATQSQYELLKALAQTGDAAEQSYGRAGTAAEGYGSLVKKSTDNLKELHDELDKLKEETDFSNMQLAGQVAANAFINLKSAVLNSVDAVIFGGKSLKQALVGIFRDTLAQTAAFLAKKAAMKGLEAEAEALMHLAALDFAGFARYQLAAAAWFALAGGVAIGGRLVAGSGGSGDASGGSTGEQSSGGATAEEERDRTIREPRAGGAPDPNTPRNIVTHTQIIERVQILEPPAGWVAKTIRSNEEVHEAVTHAFTKQYEGFHPVRDMIKDDVWR